MKDNSTPRRVVIATPCLDGKFDYRYVAALLGSYAELKKYGMYLDVEFLVHDSLIARGRNELVARFLERTADDLIFIDADIVWDPRDLIRLLAHDVDFVGAAYQLKNDHAVRLSVAFEENSELCLDPRTGLFSALRIGTGFMRLRRQGILDMMERHRDLVCQNPDSGRQIYTLFETSIVDGAYVGEDYTFCDRWKRSGKQIWVDPTIRLGHIGSKAYDRALIDMLEVKHISKTERNSNDK